ncbi:MAG: RNA-dependent ATPase [Sclerophora amabilis]|nr:MAG: RNA-dependent ATPase [Sclerophora amabilis]
MVKRKQNGDERAELNHNSSSSAELQVKQLLENGRDVCGRSETPKHNGTELSKEDRREKKRLKKLKEANGLPVVSQEEFAKEAVGSEKLDKQKIRDKAARKAEKAELKATKRAKRQAREEVAGSDSPPTSSVHPNGASTKNKDDIAHSSATILDGAAPPVSLSTSAYSEDSRLTALPRSEVDTFLSTNSIKISDPTTSASPLRPITAFAYLPPSKALDPEHFKAFTSPTPIQAAAWPFLFSGRDVIGVAETGSGKTLAFAVPCIRHIKEAQSRKRVKGVRAVIVSPTRELALQSHEQITKLAKPAGLGVVCVYGGVPKEEQRAGLETASIVVATPGRLNDLIDEGVADLSKVGFLVLDEADRMLDKGFEDEIRKIISKTTSSPNRQTLMFTATWPPSVRILAATFLSHPVHIAIGANNPTNDLRANQSITQKVEVVDPRGKEQRLMQLLKQYQSGANKDDRILVFCLYKKEATRIEGFLKSRWGPRVAGIHGDLSQAQRTASLDAFKTGKVPVLVATDVAARGLDIPAVKLVINVTFPLTVEDYVHRIGRTGRAGKEGLAITLFTEHDKAQSGALINVLKAANQQVPEQLLKYGTTVKRKGHDAYGAFYKDTNEGAKTATKIKFDG